MGLLDWFRKRGSPGAGAALPPERSDDPDAGAETDVEARTQAAHGAGVPPGSAAEGPPVGVSDPGSLGGDDDVVAADEGDELEPGPPAGGRPR